MIDEAIREASVSYRLGAQVQADDKDEDNAEDIWVLLPELTNKDKIKARSVLAEVTLLSCICQFCS